MSYEKIRKVSSVSTRKKASRQPWKYRKFLWNMMFMELLLSQMEEQTEVDLLDEGQIVVELNPKNVRRQKRMCSLDVESRAVTHPAVITGMEIDEGKTKPRVKSIWTWNDGAKKERPYRDTLELSLQFYTRIALSENYSAIAGKIRRTEHQAADNIQEEAMFLMDQVYGGKLEDSMLIHILRACFCGYLDRKVEPEVIYEHYSRANARRAVGHNNREGRRIVESCGLSWAGTTYYNAIYFHKNKQIQEMIKELCVELTEDHDVPCPDFFALETYNQFYLDGGITYHGVFAWMQTQNNHPAQQYGIRDLNAEPPEYFLYLYRNSYSEIEKKNVRMLEKQLEECTRAEGDLEKIHRKFLQREGQEYHNGRSYLIREKKRGNREEARLQPAMDFLEIFRLYRVCGCVELLWVADR